LEYSSSDYYYLTYIDKDNPMNNEFVRGDKIKVCARCGNIKDNI